MRRPTSGRFVLRTGVLLLLALVSPSAGLAGQILTETEITGSVRTAAGEPIPRSVISVVDGDGNTVRSADGGLDGTFRVRGVEAGIYRVRVEALGFAPVIYEGLRLRPGVVQRLDAVLRTGGEAVTIEAASSGAAPGSGRWLDRADFAGLPTAGPDLAFWTRLSTLVDDDLGMEGLPGQFTRLAVDGLRVHAVRPPGLRTLGRAGALFTGRTLSAAEILPDVRSMAIGVGVGGAISAHSLRGGTSRAAADGAVSTGGLRSAATDPDDPPSALSFWGGASASLVLKPDTSSLVVGGDAWQIERPRAGLLPSSGIGEEGVDEPYIERQRGFAGFARLDRRIGRDGLLWGSARVAVQPATTDLTGMAWGLDDDGERVDILAGMGLVLPAGRRETLEARVGLTRSAWSAPTESGVDLPFETGSATVADAATGLRAGPGPLTSGSTSRLDFDAMFAMHLERGDHDLTLGLQGGVAVHSQDWGQEISGLALVGDGSPTSTWPGVIDARTFRREVDATVPRLNLFVEDRWSAGPGLTLDLGGRFSSEWLPLANEVAGPEWFVQSGLPTVALQEQVTTGSAFLGFRWDQGSGTRFGTRVSYAVDEVDPLLLGEILVGTEYQATRLQGTFPGWPEPIDRSSFPFGTRQSYAYMVEDPTGPRTLRLSAGLGQAVGEDVTLDLGVVARWTDGLTRRRDLNRPALPRGIDGGGRALWGQPTRIGSWIGAAPETLGRFTLFGPVWELDQGGWSQYLGATVRLEKKGVSGPAWSLEYTWSRTEDNMPGLATAGRLAGVELAAEQGEEVTVGRSDLDRPHRAVATLSLPLPIGDGSAIAGVYRFQSGAPFTPGYAAGVDINMDGVPGNEPAFVSSEAEAAHGGDWSCLGSDVGGFATRNGCREPDVHTLDLRLSVGLPGVGAALFVDALNVLDREVSLIDTALLVADPTGTITGPPDQTRLPLTSNPNFGAALRDRSTGRMLRVGVRVGR